MGNGRRRWSVERAADSVRRILADKTHQLPAGAIDIIKARSAALMKGPEYAAWYAHDVPLLLDEIDRLRYELEVAKRGK